MKTNKQKYVILIVGSDNKVIIWNVGTAEAVAEIDLPEIPLSASWNWDGSKVAATCKDKKIRVLDARTGKIEKVIQLFHAFIFIFYV